MAEERHVALYYVDSALGSFLADPDEKGGPRNVWETVGVSPSEPGGISGQMLCNGNYFTCYACAGTHRALATEGPGGSQEKLKNRRETYVQCLGEAKSAFTVNKRKERLRLEKAAGEGHAPKRRDQAGRLHLEKYDQAWVRDSFDDWMLPSVSSDAVDYLRLVLKWTREPNRGGTAFALGDAVERALGEIEFYQELRDDACPLVKAKFGPDSKEGRRLKCYRKLLPIWVYTQCLHASSYDCGLLLNLYNVDFWGRKERIESLVDELCACFELDAPLAERDLVGEFRTSALDAANRCMNDIDLIEEAFLAECQTESPTVRELFEKSLREEWDAPEWAQNRAELIWLVLVSCCKGLAVALGEDDRTTDDCLDGDGARLDSNELGPGSGYLPLHVSEGGRDFPSVNLKLSEDCPEGVICVLGHLYDDRFWKVVWTESACRLLGDLFTPDAHMGSPEQVDAGRPEGLLARLWDAASWFDVRMEEQGDHLGDFSRLDVVSSGRLDVAGALRSSLAAALSRCLTASLAPDDGTGRGPELDLGARGRDGEGTLLGALSAAVDEVNDLLVAAWKEQAERELSAELERIAEMDVSAEERRALERRAENRGRRRPPNARGALLERLRRVTEGYFDELRRLDGDAALGLGALFRQLELAYADRCGRDPSMRFALARVRKILKGKLGKVIRLRDIEAVVKEVFSSFAKAERAAFVSLSSPYVSGRHAVLYLEGGSLMLADAGSTNGTAVMRRAPDADCLPERYVLKGGERTREERVIRVTDKLGGVPEAVDVLPLHRGDSIRLAGETVVGVGNPL